MSDARALVWTDPHGLISGKARVFLYFIRITDPFGSEYRYIGKTKNGASRLGEYQKNVAKIFAGRPRRTTPGQEKYRAIHLALAKACELGWKYEFYPLEEANLQDLNGCEQARIAELSCNMNGARSWEVAQFATLSLSDLLHTSPRPSAAQNSPGLG